MSQHESFAGRQFYHGTSIEGADGVLRSGERITHGTHSDGFYLTDSLAQAYRYADSKAFHKSSTPAVLSGEVHAENPKMFDSMNDLWDYQASEGLEAGQLRDHLVGKGHDYLGVGGLGIVLTPGVYHPKAMHEPGTFRPDEEQQHWTDLT
jgi:hypothetical protein